MNVNQIQDTYQAVLRLLLLGRLKQSFDKMQTLSNELQDWTLQERLDGLQQNYRYLLQYYIDGIEDPQRITVYNKLIAKLFSLNEEIRENLLVQNSTNFEYTKKRYFPNALKYSNSQKLFDALQQIYTQIVALAEEGAHEEELTRLRNTYEALLPEVFGTFWLKTKFLAEDKKIFQQIMDEHHAGLLEKSLIVSGLTLNLWRMFDEEKLMFLFDCCESENVQVKQRALVGLCLILVRYNQFLSYFPMIRNRLVLMADDERTLTNFRNIIMQIIGTTETEKISKKLQEEILPEIAKITPKLKDKMDVENLLDSDDWEEMNPQWQEMIEESGVSEKLKELSELQIEGADVYMSTFSMLKNFPFFSELSNWFLPFESNHTAVQELFDKADKGLLSAFISSQVMCDSDLYSFCLSMLQMPKAQRQMMKHSFKMESEQIDEIKKDEALIAPDISAKNISKQYIQNLFRFFKLYPQRRDFIDMFDSSLIMHKTSLFDILSSGNDFKSDIAEYYFSKKLYVQALELFNELLEETNPTTALYQKIGYAYQKTSQLSNALNAYLKADMIQPDDAWTVKKIALCYRLAGNYEKALEYYKHADFLNPGQFAMQMQIANSYLQAGKYKESLKLYYKLDAENEDNVKIQRAIAWTLFVSGNLKEAEYYIQKVLENKNPTAHDYLNAGHIAWCQKSRKAALVHYRQSLALQQNKWEVFLDVFKEDLNYLKANGIDANEIPLMLDEALYSP